MEGLRAELASLDQQRSRDQSRISALVDDLSTAHGEILDLKRDLDIEMTKHADAMRDR